MTDIYYQMMQQTVQFGEELSWLLRQRDGSKSIPVALLIFQISHLKSQKCFTVSMMCEMFGNLKPWS